MLAPQTVPAVMTRSRRGGGGNGQWGGGRASPLRPPRVGPAGPCSARLDAALAPRRFGVPRRMAAVPGRAPASDVDVRLHGAESTPAGDTQARAAPPPRAAVPSPRLAAPGAAPPAPACPPARHAVPGGTRRQWREYATSEGHAQGCFRGNTVCAFLGGKMLFLRKKFCF